MQHDRLELVDPKEPVAADGCVLRGHGLERTAPEIAREDDVHDVLRREAPLRGDRVDDRNGALERQLEADSDLLRELPVQRVHEALARVDSAAGQQPVLASGLLVPAEKDASVPAEDRRDADSWLGAHQAADEPKPRTPRSASGSSSTSTGVIPGTGTTTSWAIRIPGSTTKACSRSVFRSTTRSSPR